MAKAAKTTEQPEVDPSETRTVLVVTARRDGFRRAGFVFGVEPVELDALAIGEDAVKAITSDPMLVTATEQRPANPPADDPA
jgi:hypothetical protein